MTAYRAADNATESRVTVTVLSTVFAAVTRQHCIADNNCVKSDESDKLNDWQFNFVWIYNRNENKGLLIVVGFVEGFFVVKTIALTLVILIP